MFKKILGTAGARLINAVVTFVVLFVITHNLGREGMGTIGLILLDINIIQLFIDLFAGSALIYMASRTSMANLMIISYSWIIVAIVGFAFLFGLMGFAFPELYHTVVPAGYEMHILTLATISAYMLTHYNLLLGKERIKIYNIISSVQTLLILLVFVVMIYVKKEKTVGSYVMALYTSYSFGVAASLIAVLRSEKKMSVYSLGKVVREVFHFGFVTSVANILFIGNKRIGYYLVRYFTGLSSLGVLTAGTQLTEGLKLIGQSISVVQFSKLANTTDTVYAKQITIKLLKVSVVLTLMGLIVMLVLPVSVYGWVFGAEFVSVKPVILLLAPGVLALAANAVFAHFFSGMGNPKINLYANIVGFSIVLILAVIFVPMYGFLGAAGAVSVSYLVVMIYYCYRFKKQTGIKISALLPKWSDVVEAKNALLGLLSKSSN
ncbi:MAG: hypothetical protein DRJ09_10925 [Bacteroidetes bacterium]|nr:MAG: hypothetical protein DRJ09_10925 [Bacteroidota bacterium]